MLRPRVAGSPTERRAARVVTERFAKLGLSPVVRARGSTWAPRGFRSLSPAERRNVRLALSLDMVGYGPELNVRGLERRPNRSAQRALAAARRLGIGATYLRDRGQSDHEELTRGGVRAAWIEWRWDQCWHTSCDRVGRVEPAKLAAAIRLTVNAVRAAT